MTIRRYKRPWSLKTSRIIWGRKPKKERRKIKSLITFLLIIGFVSLCYNYIEKELLPTVMAISEFKIRTMSTNIISKAVDDTLNELNINTESLVTYYYDDEGNYESFGVNSVLINQISSEIVERINNEVNGYKDEQLSIPLGKLLGKSVFANSGPRIHVNVLPYGTATTNYKSSFEATGINQINHRIWINVQMTMQVIVPLNSTKVTVCQDVTMIDRVINGQIPSQYINVPKDEILNVVE